MSHSSSRPSPDISATSVPIGTIEEGNDGEPWVAVMAKNGVQRWMPYTSAKLNGMRVLTVDYLAQNVGKSFVIYDRSMSNKWPSGPKAKFEEIYAFIPNGDATPINRKKPFKNWLFTRSPDATKVKGYLMINGVRITSKEGDIDRYWGPIVTGGGGIASSNPRNTQSFVRATSR